MQIPLSTRQFVFLSFIVLGAYVYFSRSLVVVDVPIDDSEITRSALNLEQDPVQRTLTKEFAPSEWKGFRITPVASIQLQARVLGAEHYSRGEESKLMPVDLALGWGPMARDEVLREIKISQYGRFYFWRVEHFPIPRHDIDTHSTNMHMIPTSLELAKALQAVGRDEIVELRGYLVNLVNPAGSKLNTSLSREDTGAGACEVVLLKELRVLR